MDGGDTAYTSAYRYRWSRVDARKWCMRVPAAEVIYLVRRCQSAKDTLRMLSQPRVVAAPIISVCAHHYSHIRSARLKIMRRRAHLAGLAEIQVGHSHSKSH